MRLLIFFFSGVFFWTFLEYIIHRFFGHLKNGTNEISIEHMRHHREGNYFAPMWKKLILATMVLSVSTLIVGAVFGFIPGFVFSFGLAGMYSLYEYTHRRLHSHEAIIRYGEVIRKHHFYHHFRNPKYNHGVTIRFWDRIFGTFRKAELVPVPVKFAMPWLTDESGHVKPKYETDYRLK